jgi:hypothetical protein
MTLAVLSVPAGAFAAGLTNPFQGHPWAQAGSHDVVNATNASDDAVTAAAAAVEPQNVVASLVAAAIFKVRAAAADAALVHAEAPLDDQVLSRQRGGAANGMMTVSTSTLLKNNVTLWDEIVPPTPMPQQPSDAARAAQGNNVVYTRK